MKNIYHMVLTDHFRNPRNNKTLQAYDVALSNVNPLCGDTIDIQLKCHGAHVTHVGIQAHGCVISVAVASLLSEIVINKHVDEVEQLNVDTIQHLVGTELGPTRLKCAMMGLKAIQEGIKKYKGSC